MKQNDRLFWYDAVLKNVRHYWTFRMADCMDVVAFVSLSDTIESAVENWDAGELYMGELSVGSQQLRRARTSVD